MKVMRVMTITTPSNLSHVNPEMLFWLAEFTPMMKVMRMMTITTPSTAEQSSAGQSSSGRETGARSAHKGAVKRYSHVFVCCVFVLWRCDNQNNGGCTIQQMLDVCGTSIVWAL